MVAALPVAALCLVGMVGVDASVATPSGAATLSPANGQGSTYAGLAFQQWTQSIQSQGLNVNYTPTSSPAGLTAFAQNTAAFAGTEAEFSELGGGQSVPRGFEYTPDVAGATAIMYHVALDPGGAQPVNYLHLTPLTIAKIFLGKITNWNDPAIAADNASAHLQLPNKAITVDCRSGQSGTTALFYDFVAHTDPSDYAAWAQQNGFSTGTRILEVDNAQVPSGMQCYSSSDLQAQSISSSSGLWSIGYDEFGYAKVYNDNVAWVQNASGTWVQPYAQNISAALQSAQLAPDTSQDLSGVYTSSNQLAYPISAYSYILVQCAPNSARTTCTQPYSDAGVANTMAQFMDYVACAGQIHMADIGYAPLPPQLSQFLANAVGWMLGQPAKSYNPSNCSNPTFTGGLGVGAVAPPDPVAVASGGGSVLSTPPASSSSGGSSSSSSGSPSSSDSGSGSGSAANGSGSTGGATSSGTGTATTGTTTTTGVNGTTGKAGGTVKSAGGGSSVIRPTDPAMPVSTVSPSQSWVPLLALLLVLALPVVILSVRGRRPRSTPRGGGP